MLAEGPEVSIRLKNPVLDILYLPLVHDSEI